MMIDRQSLWFILAMAVAIGAAAETVVQSCKPPQMISREIPVSEQTPGVDVWMPKTIDEQDPIEELRPISEDAAIGLQRQIDEYERNRPRHVVTATPADIDKSLHDWAKALVERDMGSSIVDGGQLPLHAKIDAHFELQWRFVDLRNRVDSLEREVMELRKLIANQ